MDKYKNLHKWMIIPMLVMQIGIFIDYWGDFSENTWSVHIHYWTATLWYLFLILQPYYATHGMLARHRTNGIIGMFLGGGVGITAFSMLHRDLASAQLSADQPENFGPFEPWFFFGVAAVEIVMIIAFIYVVMQSILHRKTLEQHAWWLISSVFVIMMPALARGIQNVWIMIAGFGPDTEIMIPVYLSQCIIIVMIFWAATRYGRIRHPATYLAVAVNAFVFLLEPLGRSEVVQTILTTMIKG